ncbi:MAG: hypothetical protein JST26_06290 [Bacteroidetes bacterium]|nr:hypothetical protein [Bacteroidota bacterium]
MRTKRIYIVALFAFVLLVMRGQAQGNMYTANMKKGIAMLDTARGVADFTKAAAVFEKVNQDHPGEWLPHYYIALCQLLVALEKKGNEIDAWCDKSEKHISRADSLSGNNSEIYVLKSLLASARIQVNKTARGQKFGGQAYKWAEEAIKLDASNPRAWLQKATAIYYTPPAFGGGAKKAKPVFDTAMEKFTAFKVSSNLYPHWGKDRAKAMLHESEKQTTVKTK